MRYRNPIYYRYLFCIRKCKVFFDYNLSANNFVSNFIDLISNFVRNEAMEICDIYNPFVHAKMIYLIAKIAGTNIFYYHFKVATNIPNRTRNNNFWRKLILI